MCGDIFRATAQCDVDSGSSAMVAWVLLALSVAVHARGLCACDGETSDDDDCNPMYT